MVHLVLDHMWIVIKAVIGLFKLCLVFGKLCRVLGPENKTCPYYDNSADDTVFVLRSRKSANSISSWLQKNTARYYWVVSSYTRNAVFKYVGAEKLITNYIIEKKARYIWASACLFGYARTRNHVRRMSWLWCYVWARRILQMRYEDKSKCIVLNITHNISAALPR